MMAVSKNKKRVFISLPNTMLARLESEAGRLGLQKSDVVTLALDAYLPTVGKEGAEVEDSKDEL